MGMYYEGYQEARQAIANMTESQLLDQLDALYGRDNLPKNYTLEQLRDEARDQVRRDFTDTSSREYELAEFYKKVLKASRS